MAGHLPRPFVDPRGTPCVPAITALVLERFEKDDRTFGEFYVGSAATDFYAVEGGNKRLRDAEEAEQFLDHPLKRIREWAREASESARADAARQRVEEEERVF
jgi:hypothetical protein